jgi:hypothetical protein
MSIQNKKQQGKDYGKHGPRDEYPVDSTTGSN